VCYDGRHNTFKNKQTNKHVSMIEITFPKTNRKTHASWWQRQCPPLGVNKQAFAS